MIQRNNPMSMNVFFVDFVNFNAELTKQFMADKGINAMYFSEFKDLQQLEKSIVPTVLVYNVDLKKDDVSWFYKMKTLHPGKPIIVLSSPKYISSARKLVSDGGFLSLRTPLNMEELYNIILRAREYSEKKITTAPMVVEQKDSMPLLESLAENSDKLLEEFASTFPEHITVYNDLLLQKMAEMISVILGVDSVSLMLVDPTATKLKIAAQKGLPPEAMKRPPIRIGEGIAGYVAKMGQPILTNNIEQFKHLTTLQAQGQYKTGSFISLPLKIGSRVIGVVNVNNKRDGSSFSQEDLLVLEILNSQVLLSLRNAQLLNDQRQQFRTAQVLNEIDQVIIQQDQPEEMFSILLNKCLGMLECETLILFMLDSEFNQDILYVRSFLSIHGGIKEPAVLSLTEGVEGMILNIKKPVLISNAENDERISPKVRKMVHNPIKSIAAYPIILFDKVIGVIEAVNKQKQPKFTREDLYLMKQLTYKIFLALMKNNLYNEKAQMEGRLRSILNRGKA